MRPAVAIALAGGAVVALGACGSGGSGTQAAGTDDGTTTAQVQRTTLITRQTVSGTLGYADQRSLLNRAGGATQTQAGATITWLPDEGAIVRRGGALYRLDGEAVRLLYGTTPAYRTMSWGDAGTDVEQLERNLKALGYDPGDVDGTFDGDTYDAVRAWQEDAGWTKTGQVELGQVAFLPAARRIGEIKVATGDVVATGAEVLETTARRQVVTIDLDADDQELAKRGEQVTVSLPGGRSAKGRISHVGAVAHAAASDTGGQPGSDDDSGEEEDATIDVTVRLNADANTGRLDGAPVSVGLVDEVGRDVLAVPVTALLAKAGGGYAVDKQVAGGVQRVPVRVGQFTDGEVAVTSPQLQQGDTVVVPDGDL
jgi:peptidoglycan hydrolase-like protein with peptidoglycan-binding domain